jgi:glycosyltransferase involved in cell wall biosynthesis
MSMSIAPAVSVVIPTYNRADLIAQAVQSVLDQAGINPEIIVVDDGSTDDTPRVLGQFNGKIRYLATENRGVAHARNTGMKASSGKYIAFLDSDDLYLPGKLALQVAFMEAHPEVGVVSTEMSAMIGNTVTQEYFLRSYHGIYNKKGWSYEDVYPVSGQFHFNTLNKTVPFYIGSIFRQILQGQVLFTNTVLFKRNILATVGYQNESYRTGEEYEYLVRICRHFIAAFLDIPTYIYRYHDHQLTLVASKHNSERKLTEIKTEMVFLQAVLDWGVGDNKYYNENKDWINRRIAELYCCIGKKWLEIGETGKARENFSLGRDFDPSYSNNIRGIRFSYFPNIIRRGVNGVSRRLQAFI